MWIPLELSDCDPNPFVQFRRWFDEAKGEMLERDAISVATSTPDGKPSTRMVLLRHVDDTSVGWFTNYDSRKGHELEDNPFAAILWYCEPRGRQVRMEGAVEKMTAAESDAYFATRARGSQLGAHASAQSQRHRESRGTRSSECASCDDRVRGTRRSATRQLGWLPPHAESIRVLATSRGPSARPHRVSTRSPNGWTLERQAP